MRIDAHRRAPIASYGQVACFDGTGLDFRQIYLPREKDEKLKRGLHAAACCGMPSDAFRLQLQVADRA